MEETAQRLRQAADNCVKAYETWTASRKNLAAREALQDAVHELRRVSARLEIEVAASERDEMTQRQIPIPPHRSARRRPGEGGDLPDFITSDSAATSGGGDDDSIGNAVPDSSSGEQGYRPQRSGQQQGRSGGGGFQRRPMRSRPQSSEGNE